MSLQALNKTCCYYKISMLNMQPIGKVYLTNALLQLPTNWSTFYPHDSFSISTIKLSTSLKLSIYYFYQHVTGSTANYLNYFSIISMNLLYQELWQYFLFITSFKTNDSVKAFVRHFVCFFLTLLLRCCPLCSCKKAYKYTAFFLHLNGDKYWFEISVQG